MYEILTTDSSEDVPLFPTAAALIVVCFNLSTCFTSMCAFVVVSIVTTYKETCDII